MYYEKTNGVCDNQNSLERATVELKKVNISINKYPLFSVSLRTLLDKIKVINLFSSVRFFSFLSNALFYINGFYLSDTVHKQHIFFFISHTIALILSYWEMVPL